MHDDKNTPKIGAGHARAMWRMGLDELRNADVPDGSNVAARHVEAGIYGTVTPGEVSAQREADPQSPTLKESPLLKPFFSERSQGAQAEPDTARNAEPARDREPDMERE